RVKLGFSLKSSQEKKKRERLHASKSLFPALRRPAGNSSTLLGLPHLLGRDNPPSPIPLEMERSLRRKHVRLFAKPFHRKHAARSLPACVPSRHLCRRIQTWTISK